jgi:hypothetical protein
MDLISLLLLREPSENCRLAQVVFKLNVADSRTNRTVLVFKEA